MRKSILVATALASSALYVAPALAQEAEEHWEGGYVGGTFGLGALTADRGDSVVFDTNQDGTYGDTVNTVAGANAFAPGFCNGRAFGNSADQGCRNDREKFDYSVRAGYDTQMGNFVIGVLVEAAKSDSVDYTTAFSSTPASYTFARKLDYSLGARGRAGIAAKGALFYATGGFAYGQIKNAFFTTNGVNSFADNGKSKSWGYTVGGGVEAKVFKNFSMGLEFLHTNYTRDKYVVNVGPGTAAATNPFLLVSGGTNMKRANPDFGQHSIRLTAAFRF